jgi:hypothetical protein
MNVDQIRNWLTIQVFTPLTNVHGLRITLRAGDIHRVLGLRQRYPMVCQALRTVTEHTQIADLVGVKQGKTVHTTPPEGANVWYTFRIR